MKSKAPLVLIEQLIMLVVFALAAALCLRIFVWSDSRSKHIQMRDDAVTIAQQTAETIKSCGGSTEYALTKTSEIFRGGEIKDGILSIEFHNSKTQEHGKEYKNPPYIMTAEPAESGINGLNKVEITVMTKTHEELFRMETAWQGEVS